MYLIALTIDKIKLDLPPLATPSTGSLVMVILVMLAWTQKKLFDPLNVLDILTG